MKFFILIVFALGLAHLHGAQTAKFTRLGVLQDRNWAAAVAVSDDGTVVGGMA